MNTAFFRTSLIRICLIAVAGFSGGAVSSLLLTPTPSAATAAVSSPVTGSNYFLINDVKNPKGIEYYVYDGYPAHNMYAIDGKVRLQQGLYSKGDEAGLPLLAFWDNAESMRMLFRLAGKNESPVIIMKDRKGADRVVFGLNLNDPSEEPFLALIDEAGKKNVLFGAYP